MGKAKRRFKWRRPDRATVVAIALGAISGGGCHSVLADVPVTDERTHGQDCAEAYDYAWGRVPSASGRRFVLVELDKRSHARCRLVDRADALGPLSILWPCKS